MKCMDMLSLLYYRARVQGIYFYPGAGILHCAAGYPLDSFSAPYYNIISTAKMTIVSSVLRFSQLIDNLSRSMFSVI